MHCQHVIVGDGVTAAEFVSSRNGKPGDCITVVGPRVHQLGRGIAYAKAPPDAPWQYAYLLNSPTRSVDADFADWLGHHWATMENIMSGRSPDWLSAAQPYVSAGQHASLNAPREVFGDFIHAQTMEKIELMRTKGIKVRLLASCVKHIEPNATGLTVVTTDNETLEANSVDVATGGPQNQRLAGDNGKHSFPQLFDNELQIAKKLQAGGKLVCIGSGAAMLDLLRFCQSIQSESQIDLTAIAPSGKTFPALRPSMAFHPTEYELNGTFERAEDFLAAIVEQQQQALAAGDTWYETRVGLRSLFLDKGVIEFVPNLMEARKVSRPLFKHFEGGTRDSIDDFNRLMRSGHTQIIAGKVQHIEHQRDHALVHYTNTTHQTNEIKAAVVVNCAGPGNANHFDALTNQMLANKWISVCEQSGGILVGDGGQTPIKGLRYLGPAVTSIGHSVEPVPLYDALRLRRAVQKFNQA